MRSRSWLLVGLAAVAAVLLLGRAVTSLVVEHAWFTAMGVPSLWWERVTDSVLLQGGAWLAGSLFAFANLHAVRRTILAVAVPSRVANIELTAMIPGRRLLGITVVLAGLVGLGLAAPLSNWTDVAMARHGIPFGEIEGFLGRDLGFYVYWLPLEESLYVWSLVSLVAVGTMVIVLYALTRSLRLDGRRVLASSHARRHLTVLGALVLFLLSWSYRLDSFDLLRSGTGPDGLFLRVDHVVTMRVDLVMSVVSALGALALLRAGWVSQLRLAFVTLSVVLAGAIGLRHALPALLARGSVLGEPGRRDLDYLATRTLLSRRAFDVDGIHVVTPDSNTSHYTRVRRKDLATSVGVWPLGMLQARAKDTAAATTEYRAWRAVDGRLSALLLRQPSSGSEEWAASLADATQSVVRDSSVDLIPNSAESGIGYETVVAPGARGHRLIEDPSGKTLGTPLRALGSRIAHAWSARDPELLRADGTSSIFVSERDVRTRIGLMAPVFAQGADLTPVLHDGLLYWTVHLYSASAEYPLSQHWQLAGEVRSYFRLAATALVEAGTGRVRLIAVEKPDPVARTWMSQVPGLFVRPGELASELVDQLAPASDGAVAQLRTFARYGSRQEGVVPRHLADSSFAGDGPAGHLLQPTASRGATPVVAWSVPLLDNGEQIDGVISAVGGRVRQTYWDSTRVPRERWSTVNERLRGALDSTRLFLPEGSRREPKARLGPTQVLMGESGPLLMQALYWNRADGTTVVSQVGVEENGRVATGAAVGDAVAALGGGRESPRAAGTGPLLVEPRDLAVTRLYDVMKQALRSGSWTRFGAAFDSLGRVLGRSPE